MSALSRLIARRACFQMANHHRNSLLFVRAVTLKPEKYRRECVENFDLHNMGKGRPLSPHLSIYAPQLTSFLSISHRISGAALMAMMWFFGIGTLFIDDFCSFMECLRLPAAAITLLKVIISIPFGYHVIAGIRHLLWDAGMFLKMNQVYLTAYVMLATFFVFVAAATLTTIGD